MTSGFNLIMKSKITKTLNQLRYTFLIGAVLAAFIQTFAPAIFGLPASGQKTGSRSPELAPANVQRPSPAPRRIVPTEFRSRHASIQITAEQFQNA